MSASKNVPCDKIWQQSLDITSQDSKQCLEVSEVFRKEYYSHISSRQRLCFELNATVSVKHTNMLMICQCNINHCHHPNCPSALHAFVGLSSVTKEMVLFNHTDSDLHSVSAHGRSCLSAAPQELGGQPLAKLPSSG